MLMKTIEEQKKAEQFDNTVKSMGFENYSQYHNYLTETFINGNMSHCLEMFRDMPHPEQLKYIAYCDNKIKFYLLSKIY